MSQFHSRQTTSRAALLLLLAKAQQFSSEKKHAIALKTMSKRQLIQAIQNGTLDSPSHPAFLFHDNFAEVRLNVEDVEWSLLHLIKSMEIFQQLDVTVLNLTAVELYAKKQIEKIPEDTLKLRFAMSLLQVLQKIHQENIDLSWYKQLALQFQADTPLGFIFNTQTLKERGLVVHKELSYLQYIRDITEAFQLLNLPFDKQAVAEAIHQFSLGKGYYWSPLMQLQKKSTRSISTPFEPKGHLVAYETLIALQTLLRISMKKAVVRTAVQTNILDNETLWSYAEQLGMMKFREVLKKNSFTQSSAAPLRQHSAIEGIWQLDKEFNDGKNKHKLLPLLRTQAEQYISREWEQFLKKFEGNPTLEVIDMIHAYLHYSHRLSN